MLTLKHLKAKVFKKPSSLSKTQLLIFIVVFGCIGGYLLYHSFASPNPNLSGDLNGDNVVNSADLDVLKTNYRLTTTAAKAAADINGDGAVNIFDLSILASHWGGVYVAPGTSKTIDVRNDTDFTTAINNAVGGNTIVLHSGTYTRKVLTKSFSSRVIIEGAAGESVSVTVAGFDLSYNPSIPANITIRNMTVNATVQLAGASYVELSNLDIKVISTLTNLGSGCKLHGSGIEICQKSHHIDILNNKINNSEFGLRNIHIYSVISGKPDWLHDINIKGNDLGSPKGDNIQILGLYDSTIEDNYIHDPQNNVDHNDGIQLLAGDNIKILRNEFTHAKGDRSADQGIIIGRYDVETGVINPDLTIDNIIVANNLIHHWIGSGITISGATRVKIVNNTSYNTGVDAGLLITDKGYSDKYLNTGLLVWNNIFNSISIGAKVAKPDLEKNNIVGQRSCDPKLTTITAFFVNCSVDDPNHYKLSNTATTAINTGYDGLEYKTWTPANDFDDKVRVGLPDIGAREYIP